MPFLSKIFYKKIKFTAVFRLDPYPQSSYFSWIGSKSLFFFIGSGSVFFTDPDPVNLDPDLQTLSFTFDLFRFEQDPNFSRGSNPDPDNLNPDAQPFVCMASSVPIKFLSSDFFFGRNKIWIFLEGLIRIRTI